MAPKHVTPSVHLTSFNCAHCGTLTTQFWHVLGAQPRNNNDPPPIWDAERIDNVKKDRDPATPTFLARVEKLATGEPEVGGDDLVHNTAFVWNLWLSKCMECKRLSIWLYDRLLWPTTTEAPDPNPDLPIEVLADYSEAGSILSQSPRGSAALLRLGLQKLCKHLGGKGSNINDDIAGFVAKGLDVRIQRALDIVRVIGNEAVHPGQIDLRDNRATAEELFRLLNVIAEALISQPKHIEEMYRALPAEKLKAIEDRDRVAPAISNEGSEGG